MIVESCFLYYNPSLLIPVYTGLSRQNPAYKIILRKRRRKKRVIDDLLDSRRYLSSESIGKILSACREINIAVC